MLIEDPDSFKAWLTSKLEPLCDADPAALAKYVYALVKKDKPVEELRASMLEQLEVFLQRETQGFVNLLFRTLETQCFDAVVEPVANNITPPVVPPKAVMDLDMRESVPLSNAQEEPDRKKDNKEPPPAIVASAQNSSSFGNVLLATATGRRDTDRHVRKSESDKEGRDRRVRRRGSSASPDRRRSRSRSFERRRSRSRDRDRARAWRNKSPPPRRYDRRRSYSKTPPRRYSKSRSPQSKRNRYRNRSPPRSRSRSPLDNRERKDAAAGISPRDNNHGDTDLRNIQSVVAVPTDLQAYPRRCRDFDEKGFCMRGDLCPYDHGNDPVILEDSSIVPMYNGGPPQQPPLIPQGPPPPSLIRHPTAHPPLRAAPPAIGPNIEYNPDAPSMEPRIWGRPPQFRGGPIMRGMPPRGGMGRGGFPLHQRELINVVTAGTPHFRHQRPPLNSNSEYNNSNNMQTRTNSGVDSTKPGFDYGRLGGNRPPFTNKSANASLQLKRVPIGANNITHLNNHFSKFGKIVNIQVMFEGDPESALITFSNHTEANIAYKSTEAVLNNRFIRVFWYNNNNNNNSNNNTNSNNTNNVSSNGTNNEVTIVNNSLLKTLYIPSAMKKETTPTVLAPVENNTKELATQELKKKIEEVTAAKKKQEEARKAGIKMNADLRKRKQELLEKNISQQKLLVERLESPTITPQQKATLLETIKTLQESIENIRKDLANIVKAVNKPSLTKVTKRNAAKDHLELVKKTREEVQRELLDAELDLITRQHEGKNTDDIKKKIAELKVKALSLGIPSTRGAYRGRGVLRPRGRGRGGTKFVANISYDHNVVDHRPTKLLVSGYEQDDKSDVITHFEQYGEILDYISDDATPSLVLNFKLRKDAEVALTKGRNFHDRLLSVTWATHNNNIRPTMASKPTTPIQRSVMVMEDDEIGEEILEEADDDDEYLAGLSPPFFLHEEEEEEEDEDRSWRR